MNFVNFIFQDWKANKGNPKGKAFLILFRIANFCATKKNYKYVGFPYILIYKFLVQWFFSIEIPWTVKIGKNLALYHGIGIVLNNKVVIGNNCTLRHCTTIGVKQLADGSSTNAPTLGNNIDVGNNVSIIGNIIINDNCKIGSGAVVVKSVSGNCIVIGNPAIERKSNLL